MILSSIKLAVLTGIDSINQRIAPRPAFTRPVCPATPLGTRTLDQLRAQITASAEEELRAFVVDGVFIHSKAHYENRPDIINDLGDSAIWQGVYTAMTCLRWRSNRTDENRRLMVEAAWALSAYFHGGILCRGAMPSSLKGRIFHIDQSQAGRYFEDAGYTFREDASLDSLLGAMFGAAVVSRFGDPDAATALAPALRVFAERFTRDGYRLTNRDGSPTKYGDCRPGFFQAPVRILAACLPSLVSGGDEWEAIARRHAPEFATTETQIPSKVSWVNAHLAMLANLAYVMATAEKKPGHAEARRGLHVLLDKHADAGNAFLIYGCVAAGVPISADEAAKGEKILAEFPLGPKPRVSEGSGTEAQPVPVWRRPPYDVVWQRSPYVVGGHEDHVYSRLDYLISHYLSRSFNL